MREVAVPSDLTVPGEPRAVRRDWLHLAEPAGPLPIWAAATRVAGLPVTGFDRLSSGTGQMSWRLLGLFPVVAASGADVTRSACGRLAGEITLLPTAFHRASWLRGERPGTAVASLRFGSYTESAELSVGDNGRLFEVRVDRWGNPDGAPFGRHPFGVSVEAESQFGGITLPWRPPPESRPRPSAPARVRPAPEPRPGAGRA
jgi:hypothetical protein